MKRNRFILSALFFLSCFVLETNAASAAGDGDARRGRLMQASRGLLRESMALDYNPSESFFTVVSYPAIFSYSQETYSVGVSFSFASPTLSYSQDLYAMDPEFFNSNGASFMADGGTIHWYVQEASKQRQNSPILGKIEGIWDPAKNRLSITLPESASLDETQWTEALETLLLVIFKGPSPSFSINRSTSMKTVQVVVRCPSVLEKLCQGFGFNEIDSDGGLKTTAGEIILPIYRARLKKEAEYPS